MDYQLAKELKDAGFPQRGITWLCEHGEHTRGIPVARSCKCVLAYAPTLEELIEACGDRFWDLKQEGTNQWESHDANGGPRGKGSTPSEAVARLWLALNKK